MRNLILLILIIPILTGCRGCSRNKHKETLKASDSRENSHYVEDEKISTSSVIRMREESGVYFVPIKINGIDMEFVFDTGASDISISQTEALFLLKQGRLTENDFRENIQFTDANGDISDGTRINLKEVQIGDVIVYDVEASVVHNLQAPLLFGQSAMNRFGKITIDYDKKTIKFN
jgi:aspartyl protease family protein